MNKINITLSYNQWRLVKDALTHYSVDKGKALYIKEKIDANITKANIQRGIKHEANTNY